MTERELIRRLENTPVPPPPEDLAARIINDIPSEIEVHPNLLDDEIGRRRRDRRPMWLAAAAAVTIALTGVVTWELRNERPSVEMLTGKKHQRENVEVLDEFEEGVVGRLVETDEIDAPIVEELSLQGADKDDGEPLLRSTDHFKSASGAALPAPALEKKNAAIRQVPMADLTPVEPLPEEVRRRSRAQTSGSVGERNEMASKGLPGDNNVARKERPVDNLVIVLQPGAFADEMIVEAGSSVVDTRRPQKTAGRAPISPSSRLEEEPLALEVERLDVGRARDTSTRTKIVVQGGLGTTAEMSPPAPPRSPQLKKSKGEGVIAPPSTGGTAEPNDQPYGDVFFEHTGVNPFVDTEDDHLSTFGLDVDTGSFTIARQYLRGGHLPPRASIRVEEFVNAFDYGDRPPRRADFRLIAEGATSAFAAGARTFTLRLAVKAREVDSADRPPAVLVFCVDVSGSMNRENRLGLVKKALRGLLGSLRRDDHVGLVVYGSSGRVVLKPTTNHDEIQRAIDRLRAGGSTNAEEGLVLAYDLLSDGDEDERIRRVILCSDGVANVGRTGPDSILERIRLEAGDGIELTTVGFGMGNYNDVLMERLADEGDGRYAYVDDLSEARRIFVEELTGTLLTLGHDAKAQVEFDPDIVSRWRLLGYENRDIADHLFRDPSVDAGEIGAGHTVTAVYEVKLRPDVGRRGRVATLRLRYRPMGGEREVELEETLRVSQLARSWEDASPALKLASTVAEFAEILKGAYWAKDGDLGDVLRRLQRLQAGAFEGDGRVAELGAMVARARALLEE